MFASLMVLQNCSNNLKSTEHLHPKLSLQYQKPVFIEEALDDMLRFSYSGKHKMVFRDIDHSIEASFFITCDE